VSLHGGKAMAKLPGGEVTKELMAILADNRAPQKLKDTVVDLLVERKDPARRARGARGAAEVASSPSSFRSSISQRLRRPPKIPSWISGNASRWRRDVFWSSTTTRTQASFLRSCFERSDTKSSLRATARAPGSGEAIQA
jgi:hypothetical protein